MVPFLSVKETAKSIKWDGQDDFNQIANLPESKSPQLKDANEAVYGSYVRARHLMYARIYGAGHMINENKAPQAKDMFYTWLFNEKKFGT
jgi:cathepsin A (carboxypeptidase C)